MEISNFRGINNPSHESIFIQIFALFLILINNFPLVEKIQKSVEEIILDEND
ncbi:MAG: hypothetical protein HDR52_03440 [Treponema sp.]|nr:hypothetical protein [Treponema sp.]